MYWTSFDGRSPEIRVHCASDLTATERENAVTIGSNLTSFGLPRSSGIKPVNTCCNENPSRTFCALGVIQSDSPYSHPPSAKHTHLNEKCSGS